MTRERGVRSNAMVVFMQVAITSGNGRNANIMHDGTPQRLSWLLRFEKHSFFPRPPRILKVIPVRTSDLCERVGTGISFRPLKAASAILARHTFNFTRSLLEVPIFGPSFGSGGGGHKPLCGRWVRDGCPITSAKLLVKALYG